MIPLICIAVVLLAAYLVVRKFKIVDERLRSDRAQREARMLAAALTWKNSKGNKDSESSNT